MNEFHRFKMDFFFPKFHHAQRHEGVLGYSNHLERVGGLPPPAWREMGEVDDAPEGDLPVNQEEQARVS